MTTATGLEVQPDDLALIRRWIVEQEQFWVMNNRPAPITIAQRKAFKALLISIRAPARENHVGTLQEFCQGRHMTVAYIYGGVAQEWTCQVTVQGSIGINGAYTTVTLPSEGDGNLSAFSSKALAKQNAASCAIDWLVSHGLMMNIRASDETSSSRSTPTTAYTQPVSPSTTLNGASSVLSSEQSSSFASVDEESTFSETLSSGDSVVNVDQYREFEPATAQRPQQNGFVQNEAFHRTGTQFMSCSELVASLCNENNIPQPRYQIDPGPTPDLYTGLALFEHYGDAKLLRLQSASVVNEAYRGKQAIREAIAAKLVGPLREIEAVSREELRLLWERVPPML